jgi:uncharacterized membrane protein
MTTLELVLVLATLLCALVAGFVFAFATVVMPGLGKLGDKAFIRSFQVIDGVIQSGQPAFGLVWLGSAIALSIAAVMGYLQLEYPAGAIIVVSALAYIFGVQLPTFRVNVPLNNALQALEVDAMDDDSMTSARTNFEARWVRWNMIRTIFASLVSIALMFLLLWL